MIDTLIGFFKQSAKYTKEKTPSGLCPNCWGEQEYDKRIRVMYEDKQIDVNNYKANHAFIQDFVINKIDGIKLIKANSGYNCPTCKKIISEKP